MTHRQKAIVLGLVASPLLFSACGQLRAKAVFQDASKAYKDEKYKEAIALYKRAVELDPSMAEARFYLANSHQALYRPGKSSPENSEHLSEALAQYLEALRINKGDNERLSRVRSNTLVALVQIYSEEPNKNYNEAQKYATDLVKDHPDDLRSLFALAALYEKFDKYQDAESAYVKAFKSSLTAFLTKLGATEQSFRTEPNAVKACETLGQAETAGCEALKDSAVKACAGLAGFYNKPYWSGRARFDDAIGTLETCAALAPTDPVGYYKIGTFYWDKGFRDPLVENKKKDEYADKGLAAVDKALFLKPEYCDALIYKGLLLRLKAQVLQGRLRAQKLDEADTIRKLAVDCKKQQAENAQAAAAPAATP
jgi:tetratricopeptide (TPR) repeat protein